MVRMDFLTMMTKGSEFQWDHDSEFQWQEDAACKKQHGARARKAKTEMRDVRGPKCVAHEQPPELCGRLFGGLVVFLADGLHLRL